MDGPTLLVYIDGRLRKTCVIEGQGELMYNKGDIFVTQDGGFGGMITGLRIFPGAVSSNNIYKLYKRGPMYQNIWLPPEIKLPKIPLPKLPIKIPDINIKLACPGSIDTGPGYDTNKYELAPKSSKDDEKKGKGKKDAKGKGSGGGESGGKGSGGGESGEAKLLNWQEEAGF